MRQGLAQKLKIEPEEEQDEESDLENWLETHLKKLDVPRMTDGPDDYPTAD